MFGTHRFWTSTAQGVLGLRENNEQYLGLGSLFVQKYGLRIEYVPSGRGNELMLGYLYTRVDEASSIGSAWQAIFIYILMFMISALTLYHLVSNKIER